MYLHEADVDFVFLGFNVYETFFFGFLYCRRFPDKKKNQLSKL